MALSDNGIRNLVELVKLTNLMIVTVAIALFSSIVLSRKTVAQRGLDEVQRLIVFRDRTGRVSPDSLCLSALARQGEQNAQYFEARFDRKQEVFVNSWSTLVRLPAYVHPDIFLFHPRGWSIEAMEKNRLHVEQRVATLKNLRDFKGFWNRMQRVRRLSVPDLQVKVGSFVEMSFKTRPPKEETLAKIGVEFDPRPLGRIGALALAAGEPYIDLQGWKEADPVQARFHYTSIKNYTVPGGYVWKANLDPKASPDFVLQLPIKRVLDTDLIEEWTRAYAPINERLAADRSFAGSFPSLTALGPLYDSVELEDLRGILQGEINRSAGLIEAFGVVIPTSLLLLIGLPLLVFLQIQFGAICRFLSSHTTGISVTIASQWSLLLRGLGFVFYAFVTAILLPLCSVWTSIWFGTDRQWYWWLAGAIVLATSAFAASQLKRLRTRVDHGPASAALTDDGRRNLVELLKTENLTILAVALAMLSNVCLSRTGLDERASEEMRGLIGFQTMTSGVSVNTLVSAATKRAGLQPVDRYRMTIDADRSVFQNSWNTIVELPAYVHPAICSYDLRGVDTLQKAAEVRNLATRTCGELKNLRQLKDFWRRLAEAAYLSLPAYGLADAQAVLEENIGGDDKTTIGNFRVDIRPAEKEKSPSFVQRPILNLAKWREDQPLTIHFIAHQLKDSSDRGSFLWKNPPPGRSPIVMEFDVPIKDVLQVDLVADWTRVDPAIYAKLSPSRSFEETFPALTELGKNYESLDLPDLLSILQAERTRSKGTVQLLGVKIPSELLVILGLPLIAVLQFQFAAICRFLSRQSPALSFTVASQWSILLRGWHFFVNAFLASVVLPFAAVCASIFFTTNWDWYWWVGGVLIVFTSAIAGRDLNRLRRKVDLELG